MEGTTIFLSKEFHDWIKSKGRKGESYENIMISLLKPEYNRELASIKKINSKASAAPAKKPKKAALYNAAPKAISKKKPNKPMPSKAAKPKAVSKKTRTKAKSYRAAKAKSPSVIKELKELKYKKNLELQSLKVELELAKLSNDANKIRILSAQIAKFND